MPTLHRGTAAQTEEGGAQLTWEKFENWGRMLNQQIEYLLDLITFTPTNCLSTI